MNKQLTDVLDAISKEIGTKNVAGDIVTTAKQIGGEVTSFLNTHSIGIVAREGQGMGTFKLNTGYTLDSFAQLGTDALKDLVAKANVPEQYRDVAVKHVALILGRSANSGDDYNCNLAEQNRRPESTSNVIGVEELYPSNLKDCFVSNESFGATSDKVNADLQVALTISLLKWHNTLITRIFANTPCQAPVVNMIREELCVYKLDGTVNNDKSIIDLYEDPEVVTNDLRPITPLAANDDSSDPVLVADDIIKFGKIAMLLELAIDATKYGHSVYNRTDIVADGIKLKSVRFSVATATVTTPEVFEITIADDRSRLTRANNKVSTVRMANIQQSMIADASTTTVADATSAAFTEIIGDVTGAKIIVRVIANPTVDIRDGKTITTGGITVSAVDSNGDALASDNAAVTRLKAATIALVGYTLDARYAEENMRKSNIAVTTERVQLTYEIPQGRNYLLEVPMNGPAVDRAQNSANLYNVCRIGQDNIGLTVLKGVLEDVALKADIYAIDKDRDNRPGSMYAAGGRVRPVCVQDTLDMTGLDSFDDARRQEAIQGRTLTFINAVIQEILAKSFFTQQLDGNTKPTFRLTTHPEVLGNIVGARPGEFGKNSGPGVELTLVMTSGVTLECVTSTFDYMKELIYITPFLANDPSSDLNFGMNCDFGTLVGSYNHSEAGSAVQRLLANVRELPVVTNAIGAIIDVKAMASAVYRS